MLSPVDQIKERLSIIDVVSSYLKMEKAGANWKARCPFHNEKTPSFFISPSRGTYHCFGCSRGGDIFSFVEEIEGVTFAEALKTLAEKAGVNLEKTGSKENIENKKSYALLDAAAKFFETNLLRSEEIKDYLKKRGLKEETVRNFRLGFAPAGWSNLLEHLKSKGFTEKLMEDNGLILKGQKGYYDRFRGRIMFPLSDSQGRVVGFTGRIFGSDDPKEAKYVNSPETALYNKSRILYGYDKAKRAMLTENSCVIVEGQMDLLMAHQVGTNNAVAVSGTAFTEEHIKLIKRFTEAIMLAFDADQAGLKAGERGVGLALSSGMDVKMVKMPEGLDPADLILKDPASWKKALSRAKHIVDFLLEHFSEKKIDDRNFRLDVSKKVLPYVAEIGNQIDQAHFIKKIAGAIGISEEDVRAEVVKISRAQKAQMTYAPLEKSPPRSLRRQLEEKILGICLWKPELEKIKKSYEKIAGKDLGEEAGKLSPAEKNDLIFQSEMYYAEAKDIETEAQELVDNFEKETLEEKLGILMKELKAAEDKKEEKEAEEIMKQCHEISKRINEIKNSRFLEK